MESEEKEIQTKIKRPTFLLGAKRFFFGRFNPKKLIEKNVFSGFRERINKFKEEELKNVKKSHKFTSENVIEEINDISAKKTKSILSKLN